MLSEKINLFLEWNAAIHYDEINTFKITMRRLLLCFMFLFSSLIGDEIQSLEQLINATRKQLIWQEQILELTKSFQEVRAAFLASDNDPRLGARMVRKAMLLHEAIEQAHLGYLFSNNFLEEVAFFNDMGKDHLIKK